MPDPNHAAFDDTYRRAFPMILSKCHRMLSHTADAHDLAQEVFMRLWRSRESIDDPRALTAWLYRTCTRLAIDRARDRGRQHQLLALLALGQTEGSPSGDPERRSASRQALAQLLARTPARELEVALLSRVDGLNHAEIAGVLEMGERTVRRLLARFQERCHGFDEGSAAGPGGEERRA